MKVTNMLSEKNTQMNTFCMNLYEVKTSLKTALPLDTLKYLKTEQYNAYNLF